MYRIVLEKNGKILKDESVDADALAATVYFEDFCKENNTEGDCILYKGDQELSRSSHITTRGRRQ